MKKIKLILITIFASCFVFCGAYVAIAYESAQVDISWYVGHENDSTYELDDPGDFAGFSQLVNGTYDAANDGTADYAPISFEDKEIHITQNLSGLSTQFAAPEIEVVGTEEHPFNGTITGWDANKSVATERLITFEISVTQASDSLSNIGLFGYTGSEGSIEYLSATKESKVSVSVTSGDCRAIENVGSLIGMCEGDVSHCTSEAIVTVKHSVDCTKDAPIAVQAVGGLVGCVSGDMSYSKFAGSLSVDCSSAMYVNDSGNSDPVVLAAGGVVGRFGVKTTTEAQEEGETESVITHGTLTSCTNNSTIEIATYGKAIWGERFGEWVFPESGAVGGIVGYSYGSIVGCTNYTKVTSICELVKQADYDKNPTSDDKAIIKRAVSDADILRVTYSGADAAGGICGNLRGDATSAESDDDHDNGSADDPIVISDCVNYGQISGYHATGGIVGLGGTYSTITRCQNSGDVRVYRWNKPSGAGIAGQAYSSITYCYNLGSITSVPGAGYYCGGIVGMSFRFWDNNLNPLSPEPQIYSNYNAGSIYVESGEGNWRQGGIVGQNDGYVHDNVLLKGVVYGNRVAGNGDGAETDYGSCENNTVVTEDEMQDGTAIAYLNVCCDSDGWSSYWTVMNAATVAGNEETAYPVLNTQVDLSGATTLQASGITATCTKNAVYNGMESIPTLSVSYNSTALVQNVDYYVVPQSGATEYTGAEQPYDASIVGIGAYAGTVSNVCKYGIGQGDLSTCTAVVQNRIFNWENQPLTKDMITVRDSGGNVVDPKYWNFTATGDSNGEFINFKKNGYEVTITPATDDQGVTLFSGSVKTYYTIKKANLKSDVEYVGIEYEGTVYFWDNQTEDWVDGVRPAFTYTGSPIKPTVVGATYLGKDLLAVRDYRLVYGNSNSDTDYTDNDDQNTNITTDTSKACVTARFTTYSSYGVYNFTNYENFFFDIVAANELPSFVAYNQVYTGNPITPFDGSYRVNDNLTLYEGTDYSVEYKDNINVGTATYTITGLGTYKGSTFEGKFTIHGGEESGYVLSCPVIEDQEYTGSKIEPLKGSFVLGDVTLVEDTDYTVAYNNNTEKGSAYYVIYGKGNYTGQKVSGSFNIVGKALPDFTAETAMYVGKAITPFDGSYTSGDLTLTEGKDYSVTYSNNDAVGTATYTITGLGTYVGRTQQGTFEIEAPALTLKLNSGWKTSLVKYYSRDMLEALATTSDKPIGYLTADENGKWYVYGTMQYVTLEKLFEDAEISDHWDDTASLTFVVNGETVEYSPKETELGSGSMFYPATGQTEDATGGYAVPAVIALTYDSCSAYDEEQGYSNAGDALDTCFDADEQEDCVMFMQGVSEEDYLNHNASIDRFVSGFELLTLNYVPATTSYLKFDINGNGVVDESDEVALRNYLAGMLDLTSEQEDFYSFIFDVGFESGEGNGITMADLRHLLKQIKGLESSYSVNVPTELL